MRWERIELGKICELITKGTTPSTYGYSFIEKGVNFIRAEGISKDGRVDEQTFLAISEECHEKLKRSQLKENDILFTIAGMALGKTGIVEGHYLPANTNQAVALIRIKSGAAIPKFIQYQFIAPEFYKLTNSISGQAAQPNINLKQLGSLPVILPPLPTQRRIAAILSAYDDLIENNLKRIRLLEEAAQHIYREWFVHFRFPGHERVRRGADGLPEGWRRVPLEDLSLMVKRGVSPEYVTDGGFTVINQKCIRDNQIDLAHAKYSSIDKKIPDERFVRVFDVLVNSTGTGTLGRMAIVKSEMEDTFVDTHVTIVRPDPDQVAPLYLGYQLMEQKPVIENMGRGATNQIELSRSELSGLQTIVPPHELQWAFHNNIHPIIKQVAILTAQSVYAKEARDILLPRLMNRTIEV